MAELDHALAAALAGDRPLLFGAVRISLPAYTIRLLDGAGELMIGAEKFAGRDPTYGVLDTLKGLEDTAGDQAPEITLGLIPASSAAIGALIDPAVQGSAIEIMVGCVDMSTGAPIGQPYIMLTGELDVPKLIWAANDRRLEYTVTTVAERLFSTEEGRRLSDSFHQLVWPGELGLAFVTGVESWVAWGQSINQNVVETRTNLPSMGGMTWNRT